MPDQDQVARIRRVGLESPQPSAPETPVEAEETARCPQTDSKAHISTTDPLNLSDVIVWNMDVASHSIDHDPGRLDRIGERRKHDLIRPTANRGAARSRPSEASGC